MKKFIFISLPFTACQPSPRTYVNHTEGPYSIADDTLILQNELIINRSGYQKNPQRTALTQTKPGQTMEA